MNPHGAIGQSSQTISDGTSAGVSPGDSSHPVHPPPPGHAPIAPPGFNFPSNPPPDLALPPGLAPPPGLPLPQTHNNNNGPWPPDALQQDPESWSPQPASSLGRGVAPIGGGIGGNPPLDAAGQAAEVLHGLNNLRNQNGSQGLGWTTHLYDRYAPAPPPGYVPVFGPRRPPSAPPGSGGWPREGGIWGPQMQGPVQGGGRPIWGPLDAAAAAVGSGAGGGGGMSGGIGGGGLFVGDVQGGGGSGTGLGGGSIGGRVGRRFEGPPDEDDDTSPRGGRRRNNPHPYDDSRPVNVQDIQHPGLLLAFIAQNTSSLRDAARDIYRLTRELRNIGQAQRGQLEQHFNTVHAFPALNYRDAHTDAEEIQRLIAIGDMEVVEELGAIGQSLRESRTAQDIQSQSLNAILVQIGTVRQAVEMLAWKERLAVWVWKQFIEAIRWIGRQLRRIWDSRYCRVIIMLCLFGLLLFGDYSWIARISSAFDMWKYESHENLVLGRRRGGQGPHNGGGNGEVEEMLDLASKAALEATNSVILSNEAHAIAVKASEKLGLVQKILEAFVRRVGV